MIIFLFGPDDYRRAQRKNWYLNEFRKKYSNLSIGSFDLEKDGDLESFAAFLRSQSIFEPSKLAVVENVFECEAKNLPEVLKTVMDTKATTVLISEPKAPEDEAFEFLLKKPVMKEGYRNLLGYDWESFLAREAKARGVKLSAAAARFLAEAYAGQSWALVMELDKLSSLKDGVVEKSDLEKLDVELRPEYWGLMNGLRSGRVSSQLASLEKLFELGESTTRIFNILASQWREKTPVMAEYDLKIKSGKIGYEEALLDLAIS